VIETSPSRVSGLSRRAFLGRALAGAGALALPELAFAREAGALSTTPGVDLAVGSRVEGVGLVACIGSNATGQLAMEAWPIDADGEPLPGSSTVVTPWRVTTAGSAVKFVAPVAKLGANTRWAWRGAYRPAAGGTVSLGSINTMVAWAPRGEPSAFRFVFGDCMGGVPADLFGLLATSGVAGGPPPAFFACLGDMAYADSWKRPDGIDQQNYDHYLRAFRRQLTNSSFKALLAKSPFFGVQDDHDYGIDDSVRWDGVNAEGGLFGSTSLDPNNLEWRKWAAEAYADLVPNTRYHNPGAAAPLDPWQEWSIGEAHFFLLDCRRFRTPKGVTPRKCLGQAQFDWLENRVTSSTARLKVIFCPMTPSYDNGQFFGGERDNLYRMLNSSGVSGKVIICCGDKHASAFRQVGRTTEMLASPISTHVRHEITDPSTVPGTLWSNATGTVAAPDHYGVIGAVRVDTEKSPGTVTMKIVKNDGQVVHRETMAI
jgi:hypothetical protein